MDSGLAEAIIDHIGEADPELASTIRRAGGIVAYHEGETLRVEIPHEEVQLIERQDHGAERLHEGFRAAAAGMGLPWRYVEI